MHKKLQSLTALLSIAFALVGGNGKKSAEAFPKGATQLITNFNLPPHASTAPIPLNQVIEIFNQLADKDDIAFNYPKAGCFARTHLMNKHIIGLGIIPKKIWAFASEDTRLTVQLPDQPMIKWGWHVTSAIETLMPDGHIEDMVLDPALFNCPVPIKSWQETLHATNDNVEITPLGLPPLDREGDYAPEEYTDKDTDLKAQATMKRLGSLQQVKQRTVFPSKFCAAPRHQQGKTWKTALSPHKPLQ